MNADQIEGKWKQLKERWGKLTDQDLHVIAGNRDQLIGTIHERHPGAPRHSEEEAQKQTDDWHVAASESHTMEGECRKAS